MLFIEKGGILVEMKKQTVVVGMSGGVDSSVVAALLKEQGYDVIGIFMKNWEDDEECPAALDYQDVSLVATHLGIPYYSFNFAKQYWDKVFAHCLKQFQAGYTPNPDILCNREIKFKVFLEKALSLGADFVATGHYAQTKEGHLFKGADPEKDQSYFLYTLKSEQLNKVLFPIGHLTKSEVRRLAHQMDLATAAKKDSTGICFIGKRDFREFLSRYIPKEEGNFEDLNGAVVGKHQGIAHYTIGQRRGLGIGGKGEAWYVVGKDVERNTIVVTQGEQSEELYRNSLYAIEETWVKETPALPFRCFAKVRYRSADVPCTVTREEGRLLVRFDTPQKAITPRQSIVFYQDEECLGGALID